MDLVETIVARNQVRADILACERCPLSSTQTPVPFRGPTPAKIMILCDAPTILDSRHNTSFMGAEGKFLSEQLAEVGIDMSTCFMANTICCVPPNGAPSVEAMHACTHHLRKQVHLADPEWVLALGKVAMSVMGIRSTLAKMHGRPFLQDVGPFRDRWIFPTYHPGSALAVGKDATSKLPTVRADLSTFRDVMRSTLALDTVKVRIGRGGKPYFYK